MRFDVITLFPELFEPFLRVGVTRRAYEWGQLEVQCSNPREFGVGNYQRVDDRPFGGGPGMVLVARVGVVVRSVLTLRTSFIVVAITRGGITSRPEAIFFYYIKFNIGS